MAYDPEEIDPRRLQILHDAGFVWDPKLATWFHAHARRAISFESVRDRTVDWLRGWVAGATGEPATPRRPKDKGSG